MLVSNKLLVMALRHSYENYYLKYPYRGNTKPGKKQFVASTKHFESKTLLKSI